MFQNLWKEYIVSAREQLFSAGSISRRRKNYYWLQWSVLISQHILLKIATKHLRWNLLLVSRWSLLKNWSRLHSSFFHNFICIILFLWFFQLPSHYLQPASNKVKVHYIKVFLIKINNLLNVRKSNLTFI